MQQQFFSVDDFYFIIVDQQVQVNNQTTTGFGSIYFHVTAIKGNRAAVHIRRKALLFGNIQDSAGIATGHIDTSIHTASGIVTHIGGSISKLEFRFTADVAHQTHANNNHITLVEGDLYGAPTTRYQGVFSADLDLATGLVPRIDMTMNHALGSFENLQTLTVNITNASLHDMTNSHAHPRIVNL